MGIGSAIVFRYLYNDVREQKSYTRLKQNTKVRAFYHERLLPRLQKYPDGTRRVASSYISRAGSSGSRSGPSSSVAAMRPISVLTQPGSSEETMISLFCKRNASVRVYMFSA